MPTRISRRFIQGGEGNKSSCEEKPRMLRSKLFLLTGSSRRCHLSQKKVFQNHPVSRSRLWLASLRQPPPLPQLNNDPGRTWKISLTSASYIVLDWNSTKLNEGSTIGVALCWFFALQITIVLFKITPSVNPVIGRAKRRSKERGREAKLAKNASKSRRKRRNLSFLIAHAASFQKGGRVFSSSSRYKSLGSDRVGTGEWGWMKKNRVKFLLELLDMSWHITGTTSLKCHIYPFAVITQIKRM